MHLLYASQQSAGKPSMVFRTLVCEKNDPLWLKALLRALVRHKSGAEMRENFPEYFV
jgi:hypothetical protein